MNLVEKIRMLCIDKKLDIATLESELNFGKKTIYKWDKNIPSADKITKVANYFNISADYLLETGIYREDLKNETDEPNDPYTVFSQKAKLKGIPIEVLEKLMEVNDLYKK